VSGVLQEIHRGVPVVLEVAALSSQAESCKPLAQGAEERLDGLGVPRVGRLLYATL
jgi:hypothetical protein